MAADSPGDDEGKGAPADTPSTTEPERAEARTFRNVSWTGHLLAPNPLHAEPFGGGKRGVDGVEGTTQATHVLTVPAGVESVRITLTWSLGRADLDFRVFSPDGSEVESMRGLSDEAPERVAFEAREDGALVAGDYRVVVYNSIGAAMDYTVDVALVAIAGTPPVTE